VTWDRLRWPSLLLAVLATMVATAVAVRWATERPAQPAAVVALALASLLWPVGGGAAFFVGTRKAAWHGDPVPAVAALAWLVGFGLGALALSAGSVVALGLARGG
jgi:hypothetical protein